MTVEPVAEFHSERSAGLPHGKRAIASLLALGACAACFNTAESLPIGLLPEISASMHRSLSTSGSLVTIYALVVVGATVPLSHLARRVPRRVLLAAVATALVLGCVGSALAPSFGWLLVSRVFIALAQSIFWALAPVQAVSLVNPESSDRALTAIFGGGAFGLVLGLPGGTWIGRVAGWRLAFVALASAALLVLAAILIAVPRRTRKAARKSEDHVRDRGRGHAIIVVTALAVAAFYAAYTYANAFLARVSGLSHGAVALVFLGAGLASTLGLGGGSMLYARHPWGAITWPMGLIAIALLCLFGFAEQTALAPLCLALASFGLGVLEAAAQAAMLAVGPRNGTAWLSTAFNCGIASGPLIGGFTLETSGLRATPLAGALIAAAGLVLVASPGTALGRLAPDRPR